MLLSPELRTWLLHSDHPEFGDEQVVREQIVREIEATIKGRTLGGQGSGNFGHEGRPGEVGGSGAGGGAQAVKDSLPARVQQELGHVQARTFATQQEATDKIDEYLLRTYGFTSEGQAKSLADREKGIIFSVAQDPEITRQYGHLLTARSGSWEWKNVTSVRSEEEREQDFGIAFEKLMSFTNPLTAIVERQPVQDLFHKWGWL